MLRVVRVTVAAGVRPFASVAMVTGSRCRGASWKMTTATRRPVHAHVLYTFPRRFLFSGDADPTHPRAVPTIDGVYLLRRSNATVPRPYPELIGGVGVHLSRVARLAHTCLHAHRRTDPRNKSLCCCGGGAIHDYTITGRRSETLCTHIIMSIALDAIVILAYTKNACIVMMIHMSVANFDFLLVRSSEFKRSPVIRFIIIFAYSLTFLPTLACS